MTKLGRNVLEKSLHPLQNMSITPGPVYLVPVVGGRGKFSLHDPPLLDLRFTPCACHAFHLIILTEMNRGLPKQLFTYCNWFTNEENSFYPNSLLPGNLGTGTSAHKPCPKYTV